MIDRDHELSITRQAKLLDISRGTVYYPPRPVSPADLAHQLSPVNTSTEFLRSITI